MDPFEARLEFGALLSRLNASQHSIQKVGSFAMKNRNLHEDLYNCITEELEKTSINARMNILFVLDSISQQSKKAGFTGYIDLIQRNLPQLIDSIAPVGPKGNVNVAGTKKVLDSWRTKRLYHESAIAKVERPLLARELGADAPASSESGLSKDDILRRMDEDRERHKRIREDIWIRAPDEDPAAEFLQHWSEVPDLDGVDYEEMVDENQKYLPGYTWAAEFDVISVPPREGVATDPALASSDDNSHGANSDMPTVQWPPAIAIPPPPAPPPPAPPQWPKTSTSLHRSPAVAAGSAMPPSPKDTLIPIGPVISEDSLRESHLQPHPHGDQHHGDDRKRPFNDYAQYPQQDPGHHDRSRNSPNGSTHNQHQLQRHNRQTSSGSVASSSTISGTLTPLSASGTPSSSSSSSRRDGYQGGDERLDRDSTRYERERYASSTSTGGYRQGRAHEDRHYHHSDRFDRQDRHPRENGAGSSTHHAADPDRDQTERGHTSHPSYDLKGYDRPRHHLRQTYSHRRDSREERHVRDKSASERGQQDLS